MIKKMILKAMITAMIASGSTYPNAGTITEVNRASDIVTIVDFHGEAWEIESCEDWMTGDIVAMTMYDNGTSIIYDDEIIDIQYLGYSE